MSRFLLLTALVLAVWACLVQLSFAGYPAVPDGDLCELDHFLLIQKVATEQSGDGNWVFLLSPDKVLGVSVRVDDPEAFSQMALGDLVNVVGFLETLPSGERVITEVLYGEIPFGMWELPLPRPITFDSRILKHQLQPLTLRTRTFGKVSSPYGSWNQFGMSYFLDSGAGLQSALGFVGMQVSSLHQVTQGDFVLPLGVLRPVLDEIGEKAFVFYEQSAPYWSDAEQRGPEYYHITGEILATPGDAGKVATIGTDGALLRLPIDEQGRASFDLRLLKGIYILGIDVPGYRRSSQGVILEGDITGISLAVGQLLWRNLRFEVPDQRVAPGTVTDLVVSCYDTLGHPLQNEELQLSADGGSLSAPTLRTDSSGRAQVRFTPPPGSGVSTIRASSELGIYDALAYVERALPGQPSLRFLSPKSGESVQGDVLVEVAYASTEPDDLDSTVERSLIVDGVRHSTFVQRSDGSYFAKLDSVRFARGFHNVWLRARNAAGEESDSNKVELFFDNLYGELNFSTSNIVYDQPGLPVDGLTVTASSEASGGWFLQVIDMRDGSLVFLDSGAVPALIESHWDGKVNGEYQQGIYNVVLDVYGEIPGVEASASSFSEIKLDRPKDRYQALKTGACIRSAEQKSASFWLGADKKGSSPRQSSTRNQILWQSARSDKPSTAPGLPGLSSTSSEQAEIRAITTNPRWFNRALLCAMVRSEEDTGLKHAAIDELIAANDACLAQGVGTLIVADPIWESTELKTGLREYFLDGGIRHFFLVSHGDVRREPEDGEYHTFVSLDDRDVNGDNSWTDYKTAYPAFSDVCHVSNNMHIVWFNTCRSAGSVYHPCFDFALGFGLSDSEQGGTFIGWRINYRPESYGDQWWVWTPLNFVSANGEAWTKEMWRLLGQGYTVAQAERLVYWKFPDWTNWGYQSFFRTVFGDISSEVTWLD